MADAPVVRTFTWISQVVRADPGWNRKSRIVPEYDFDGGSDASTPESGMRRGRMFFGDYQERGAYGD